MKFRELLTAVGLALSAVVIFLILRPVYAATASYPGGSCAYSVVTVDAAGNVVVNCASAPVTPPVTPPVPPPVTPPTTPANVVIRPLGPSGQGSTIDMVDGVIYASPLPVASGFFDMTTDPTTPSGVHIQVSVSKTPGDMAYYKTPASCYPLFGVQQCPCGGVYNPNSAGVTWAPVIPNPPSSTPCISGAGWYVNYQMNGGSGRMVYFWRQG